MKKHQHQIKGCQARNGILFLWNVTQITLEALPLEKGQLYNEKIVLLNFFSYIFNWIYSLFRYNSQRHLHSLPISSSMRAIDDQFHLPCVRQKIIIRYIFLAVRLHSDDMQHETEDGLSTDNRKRSMRWVSHKWFGRVRLFWEELQVRVEAVSYTKLGLGEWVIEKLC